MNPQSDINILAQATNQLKLTRDEHALIAGALHRLQALAQGQSLYPEAVTHPVPEVPAPTMAEAQA